MKKLQALLLSPFSLLYGIGVSIHQALYFSGFFKAVKFSIPVINIGNLAVGGTGKSPHIEYILDLLHEYLEIGVISRGYKRKTTGYVYVDVNHTALDVGDEPIQMKLKYPQEHFAVSESRSLGIPKLISQVPSLQTILMDDGFQHLEVKAGLNILLTEYSNPYCNDFILPGGRLREWRYGSRRANIIIVTKCPKPIDEQEEQQWRKNLNVQADQHLFFSFIEYQIPYSIFATSEMYHLNPSMHVTLISAVAQSSYLVDYVEDKVASLTDIHYEDHHFFTEQEILELINKHKAISNSNKIILTTEKDATRLALFRRLFEEHQLTIFAIPIKVNFFKKRAFDQFIKNYLLEFKV